MADKDTALNWLAGDQAAMQPETFVNPMVDALIKGAAESAKAPGQYMTPNPYPPGSEEANWYENQRLNGGMDWAHRTTLSMLGTGAPMAESNAAGMFGGKLANTANLDKLEQAKRMLGKDQDRNIIRQITGWHQGPEGEWRFEIPDDRARMMVHGNINGMPLGAVLDHLDLYKAYPPLQGIKLYSEINPNFPSNTGSWNLGTGRMELSSTSVPQARLGALHEGQHAIQHIEGFTPGTTPEAYIEALKNAPTNLKTKVGTTDPYDLYHRTAGEAESRNTELRSLYNLKQRHDAAPWETHDVAYDKQLVVPPIKSSQEFPLLDLLRSKLIK